MRPRHQAAMGFRTTAARVEKLSPFDDTRGGTFWFDLPTRRPAAARLKRLFDVTIATTLIALLAPLLLRKRITERRIGFRGTEFAMYTFRGPFPSLAQLFNVLEGTMSLVGPLPLPAPDADRLPLLSEMRRCSALPGMTGLAQIGEATTDAERLRLDRQYINDWSLWLDLKILARTFLG